MAATREDISSWFDRGRDSGARYMVVLCDTFDHDDYPVYCVTSEHAIKRMKEPGSMQRVMECYDLHADKETQMKQYRAMALNVSAEAHTPSST